MTRRPLPLTIDCGTCPVRDIGCADCMVTALGSASTLADPDPQLLPLDRREREVISRLIAVGLVSAETANEARAVHEPRSDYEDLRRHAV
ncbi:hypothetical protein [Janibacter hoylei]|uniref:hypothetical protein n=1 Tax=Janibacter hoylei TaxID=364298 RepID=UPI0027BA5CE9|nr:hypothetical protein [Janibacter hoylei]